RELPAQLRLLRRDRPHRRPRLLRPRDHGFLRRLTAGAASAALADEGAVDAVGAHDAAGDVLAADGADGADAAAGAALVGAEGVRDRALARSEADPVGVAVIADLAAAAARPAVDAAKAGRPGAAAVAVVGAAVVGEHLK